MTTWWNNYAGTRIDELKTWIGSYNHPSKVYCRNYVKEQGYKSIIDCGCGVATEYYGYQNDQYDIDYTGLDSCKQFVKLNRANSIKMIEAELEKPLSSINNSTYDCVYAREVIEHLSYYETTIKELIRIGKKEVIIVWFLRPSDEEDKIDYCIAEDIYHNTYNREKLEVLIKSNIKVAGLFWEDLDETRSLLHIKLIDYEKWQVVIWGHPLHSHTHSYIHNAFDRTFRHLGFRTYWFHDGHPDIGKINFANSIFITEGQADQNIPIRDDCVYVLHNCNSEKYNQLNSNQILKLQTYTDDVLQHNFQKIDECIYFDSVGQVLYMPWATDLLPHEIDANKSDIILDEFHREVHWVGTINQYEFGNFKEIQQFWNACRMDGRTFLHTILAASLEENINKIKSSYLAPTIVGEWQKKAGYIPCRIFKNISYGKFGLTNSPRVMELFQNKLIFNDNTYKLYFDAKRRLSSTRTEKMIEELHELMNFVRDKHTYINRIDVMFSCIKNIHQGLFL